MYNRYNDANKFITDIDKLIMEDGYVYISAEEDYDISVCLEEQMECFEELKPAIIKVAGHICELDNIVQRYYKKCCVNSQKYYKERYNIDDFEDDLVIVYIDEPNIITLEYWGARENTQYLVKFEEIDNKFILKSFEPNENIPADWDDFNLESEVAKDEDVLEISKRLIAQNKEAYEVLAK